MADTSEQVSEFWAEDRNQKMHAWLQHPVAQRHLHRRITGDPDTSTGQWFKDRFFPEPVERCLTLGCGFGDFERAAIAIGIARRFDAYDISAGAIEAARKSAEEAGITDAVSYDVRDLDRIELPEATYDAIFAISSAHHIFQLENMYRQVRRALKPGGLFLLDEYVGPSRFQLSPVALELINKLRAILPARYRRSVFTDDGTVVEGYVPPVVEHFEVNDPSEAIRSGALVSTLQMYFDIVEYRPYGGAITQMLFHGIMGNFDEAKEEDVAMLKIVAIMEETLEKTGAIGSDFAAIVARPKTIA